ncbi:UNVERIFIED_CONTAM: hypothetical protein RMT77_005036 [Armadillidium vulgare]|nr:Transmembrane protein 60 [Armadillidium vulgare]
MALLHRALFTWFLFMGFLILAALRLDERTEWNWFIVFIPMWFYDGIILMTFSIRTVNDCRHAGIGAMALENRFQGHFYKLKDFVFKIRHMIAILLKMIFMVVLCLKLEGTNISWLWVFTPLLMLLTGLSAIVFHYLILQWRDIEF